MHNVILVDNLDNEIGSMEKLKAHEMGVLHRAFSIFLFNDKSELLLQKRSDKKYHSGGLWTNTCCSHPKPGETIKNGASNRLKFEMGIEADFEFAFSFVYKVSFENGLIENEFDHVFVGTFNGEPKINQNEVSDWRYTGLRTIHQEIKENSDTYTEWFKIALPRIENFLNEKKKLKNR